jgi:hypothetical protein
MLQHVNGQIHSKQPYPWHELQTFPRDGRVVEIIDTLGDVWLAAWQFGRITIDADVPVEPTHWRMI